jgi:hypothetical protein
MVNEARAKWRDRTLGDILARMRHDGCGGRAGKVELLTGIEGASSRPVRRIVLVSDVAALAAGFNGRLGAQTAEFARGSPSLGASLDFSNKRGASGLRI